MRKLRHSKGEEKMASCVYQMTWTDKVTGEKSIHTCGEEIELNQNRPLPTRAWGLPPP